MIILLVIGSFLLAVFNAGIISAFIVNIINTILGDTPISRLFKLICGILSFCLYGYWEVYKIAEFWASTEDISAIGMIIPLLIPLLIVAIMYIMNGTKNNSGN